MKLPILRKGSLHTDVARNLRAGDVAKNLEDSYDGLCMLCSFQL